MRQRIFKGKILLGIKILLTAIVLGLTLPQIAMADAPSVLFTKPIRGAANIAPSANISAFFSKDMNPSTITNATFGLSKGTTSILADVTYTASMNMAVLNPASSLDSGTVYTATIKGGTSGVRDASGNALAADYSFTFATATTMLEISGGHMHSLSLQSDGTVLAWGANDLGQLGDSTGIDRHNPVLVSGLSDIIAISASEEHSLALKSDGTVWAWGDNNFGELGDGTRGGARTSPYQIPGLTDVVAVAAGGWHSLALKSDGTVWAWGWNFAGQLGDGTKTDRYSPIRVPGVSGIVSIATGYDHTLALRYDGTVWAWGANNQGQLGNGSSSEELRPIRIPDFSPVAVIDADGSYSLAIKSDGTAWAWGDNGNGQLGNNTIMDRYLPTQIPGLSGMTTISASYMGHTLALKSDGSVYAWGNNGRGQLGDGSTLEKHSPNIIAGLSGIIAIGAGSEHSLALKQDGTTWAWGRNSFGQLGDCYTINRLTPVQTRRLYRYEQTDSHISWAGAWSNILDAGASGGSRKYSNDKTTPASCSFTFMGPCIKWLGTKAANRGMAEVIIDGVSMPTPVDLYSSATKKQEVLFENCSLSDCVHTITIKVKNTKNPLSTGYYIDVDAFEACGVPAVPAISEIAPTSGAISDLVTIKGANFGKQSCPASYVSFNGTKANVILSWTDTQIVAKVPVGTTTGPVTVTVGGLVSNDVTFTVNTGCVLKRYEETDAHVTWTGAWSNILDAGASGGSRKYSNDTTKPASCTFKFTGTCIKWIGTEAANRGKSEVWIDGSLATTVDLYNSSTVKQQVIYENSSLSSGTHSILIKVTNTKNSSSTGYYSDVDAFEAEGVPSGCTPIRYEQTDSHVSWTGVWSSIADAGASGGSRKYSNDTNTPAACTFNFTGSCIKWIGTKAANRGRSEVWIDGSLATTVDLYAATTQKQQVIYENSSLTSGTHTISIKATKTKNASSTGYYSDVDAFAAEGV